MAWYAVTFDLRNERTLDDYVKIIDALKSAKDWCCPLMSLWIIESAMSPSEIIERLRNLSALRDDDGIVVLEINGCGDFRNIKNSGAAGWLNNRIFKHQHTINGHYHATGGAVVAQLEFFDPNKSRIVQTDRIMTGCLSCVLCTNPRLS